jgi:hypothetical protein
MILTYKSHARPTHTHMYMCEHTSTMIVSIYSFMEKIQENSSICVKFRTRILWTIPLYGP